MKTDEKTLQAFHRMWDCFPGMARLIDKQHMILAANPVAEEHGHWPCLCCAKIGAPELHRGCLAKQTLSEQQPQMDCPTGKSIRGWLPVTGNPDIFVHFSLKIPQ